MDEHLQKLDEDNLVTDELKPIRVVGAMASSTKMATDTAMQRLIDAKLMSQSDKDTGLLNAEQILLMSLFNTHRDIFSVTSRRRQAVKIVRQRLDSFIERQKSQ